VIKLIDITNPDLAKAVLKIQIPAYLVEAEWIEFYEIPPLKDTMETLRSCGETFYGYYLAGDLCAVIALKIENAVIDIHRLIVNPKYFQKRNS